MTHRVFFLNTLRDGVTPDQYANWVREVGHPFAASMSSIDTYVVVRIDEVLEGAEKPPYDFVEVVETSDLDAYKAELSTSRPEVADFDEQWLKHIASAVAVIGEVIE